MQSTCRYIQPVLVGHLDAEEDAADGAGEAARDAHGDGGGEHLAVAGLVGVDAAEAGDELGEERGHDARDVDEGPLLPQRHARPQTRGQTHGLGDKGPGIEQMTSYYYPNSNYFLLCPRC